MIVYLYHQLHIIHIRSILILVKTNESRYEWWGQKESVEMKAPWKSGMIEEEAIFPLRAGKEVIQGYMNDMQNLKIEIIDSNKVPMGTAVLPINMTDNSSSLGMVGNSMSLIVYDNKGLKKAVGNVIISSCFEFDKKFVNNLEVHKKRRAVNSESKADNSNDIITNKKKNDTTKNHSSNNNKNNNSNNNSSCSSNNNMNNPTLNIIEQSPQRMVKVKNNAKQKVGLTSFQRHEASVHTDHSDRYVVHRSVC
jgi:hypothetical protein